MDNNIIISEIYSEIIQDFASKDEKIYKELFQTLILWKKENISQEKKEIIIQKCKKILAWSSVKKELLQYTDNLIETDKKNEVNFEPHFAPKNELETITLKDYIKTIKKREIENEWDIIEAIRMNNKIINFYKKNISNTIDWESYLSLLHNEINKEYNASNEEKEDNTDEEKENNQLKKIIIQETKEEFEHYIAHKISWLDTLKLENKRERCKLALEYTEFLFSGLNLKEKTQELQYKKIIWEQWDNFDWSIIINLLAPKYSYIDKNNMLVVNENQLKYKDIDIHNIELFQKRCNAIIDKNYYEEYTTGKEMINEFWFNEIYLPKK